jgi:putative hydrolase of the HAD superfamily
VPSRIDRNLRALIFDFDGLIVDSETPGYRAWSEAYAAHGCALPFEKYSACIGTIDGFDLHGYLERQTGRTIDADALEAACNARWGELVRLEPTRPGVAGLIGSAKQRGLQLAIASSSTAEWVTSNLTRLGLLDWFDVVCTRDLVAAVKPDPSLYLLALEQLGVAADEVIAFEDSPHGILAAKRAGIFCIAVPNALTQELPLDMADRRLRSLEEFNLDDV